MLKVQLTITGVLTTAGYLGSSQFSVSSSQSSVTNPGAYRLRTENWELFFRRSIIELTGPGCFMRRFHVYSVWYRLSAVLVVCSALALAGNTRPHGFPSRRARKLSTLLMRNWFTSARIFRWERLD